MSHDLFQSHAGAVTIGLFRLVCQPLAFCIWCVVQYMPWGLAGASGLHLKPLLSPRSLRVFDLRDKEHSTIIFESPGAAMPLLRIGWNKQDPRYMAAVMQVGGGPAGRMPRPACRTCHMLCECHECALQHTDTQGAS